MINQRVGSDLVDTPDSQSGEGGSIPTPTLQSNSAVIALPLFYDNSNYRLPASPLQFEIVEIPVERAKELNLKWHSRLPRITNPHSGHTVCYGALFEGRWFACAIWTDPIARLFNHKGFLELRRMAICSEAPRNTASRMLSIMAKVIKQKWPEIVKLISYQDTEVHTGTIYRASGWTEAKKTPGGSATPNASQSWVWNARKRVEVQSTAYKIRWEKDIR